MESAELIAILREVRERVRAQRPESDAGTEGIAVADLMALVHARDSALGKVAAIGTVNPRPGGLVNSVVQAWKRLVARVLDWHVREQVEFNRQVLGCVDAAIEALNEDNRALVELGNRIAAAQENLRAAQESLGQDIQAAQEGLRQEFKVIQESMGEDIQAAQESLGQDIKAAQEGLGQEIQMVQESLGPELADIRKHWAEWRAGWEHKLAQNEIQFLRSVADLQGAFQHRTTLMDTSFRETVRGQHAEFTAALERSGLDIQKRVWTDLERFRLEYERLIHSELRIIRQRVPVACGRCEGPGIRIRTDKLPGPYRDVNLCPIDPRLRAVSRSDSAAPRNMSRQGSANTFRISRDAGTCWISAAAGASFWNSCARRIFPRWASISAGNRWPCAA